jgi:hypothetical protein
VGTNEPSDNGVRAAHLLWVQVDKVRLLVIRPGGISGRGSTLALHASRRGSSPRFSTKPVIANRLFRQRAYTSPKDGSTPSAGTKYCAVGELVQPLGFEPSV